MRDITVVPDDFIITHKKTDMVMDCTKYGDIIYAVERTYTKLVQCKDCKWGDTGIDEEGKPFWKCLGIHYGGTKPTDFCSYGEKGETMNDPKPSEVRPIQEAHKIGDITLTEYMRIDGEIKRIEWVLDVKNGILYPRERRSDDIH